VTGYPALGVTFSDPCTRTDHLGAPELELNVKRLSWIEICRVPSRKFWWCCSGAACTVHELSRMRYRLLLPPWDEAAPR